jgi:hypothetical protein
VFDNQVQQIQHGRFDGMDFVGRPAASFFQLVKILGRLMNNFVRLIAAVWRSVEFASSRLVGVWIFFTKHFLKPSRFAKSTVENCAASNGRKRGLGGLTAHRTGPRPDTRSEKPESAKKRRKDQAATNKMLV